MDIKIGEQPEPMTDEEIYLYAMTKFAEADEYNARVERERREQQRLYKLEHKASNSEVSVAVVVIVFIIALVMCMF
mgnify:FL=1